MAEPKSAPLQPAREGPLLRGLMGLLGLAAYWLPLAPHPGACGSGRYTALAQALVLLCLGMASGSLRQRRLAFGPGGAGFGGGWLLHVLASGWRPDVFSCSHQLLPFEALLVGLLIVLPTWLGSLAGARLAARLPDAALAGLLALAAIVTTSTPFVLPLELRLNERGALRAIAALGQAQLDYRHNHPDQGFACRFADISSLSSGPGPRSETHDQLWTGGYHYELFCHKDAGGQASDFTLWLVPVCVPSCGDVAYCLSRRGEIRALPRSRERWRVQTCWERGTPVRTLAP